MPRIRRHTKHDPRMAPGQPIDDGGYEARAERWGGPDSHFACGRIGETFDILDALPQLLERDDAAMHECAPVGGGLDPLRAPVEQRAADRVLESGHRLG